MNISKTLIGLDLTQDNSCIALQNGLTNHFQSEYSERILFATLFDQVDTIYYKMKKQSI